MPWNGSGTFNRIYSWVADKAAGLDISSTRMDTDTNDIASQGFGNCLTRDGQGAPTTNLPMAGFKHTGVGIGNARTDSVNLGQVQDGLLYWTIDTGSATAYVATYTPALATLIDGQLCYFRAANANTGTTPTFAPNGLTARTITKLGGAALAIGDIQAAQEVELRYNSSGTRWELLNPSNQSQANALATSGTVAATIETSAPSGWLLMDDGTFGSATSGSSNSNSAANQALFTLMFNNVSDTAAPILTSTGSATTRAGQGSAAAAWAANCRMTLPKILGRSLSGAGSGSGLTPRPLGSTAGAEAQTLSTANLPPYTPAGSVTVTSTVSNIQLYTGSYFGGNQAGSGGGIAFNSAPPSPTSVSSTGSLTGTPQGGTTTAFSIQHPSTFLNFKIKQ